jgi:hypothetical protein
MSKLMPTRVIVVAIIVSAAALGAMAAAAAGALSADNKPQPGAAAAAAAQSTAGRYFEMRTYHAAPGKLDALHARFRDHTIPLFKKHDIESVAYWTVASDEGGEKDTLVFILAYPSKEARDASWKAFDADPDWAKAKADSQKDGPLVEKVEQTFMTPTDYSPLK